MSKTVGEAADRVAWNMATFVVCSKCGGVQETAVTNQIPKGWQRSHADLYCPHCSETSTSGVDVASDILEEEVIYPSDGGDASGTEDTIDESYCEVCDGPCRGH
jgi:hypothetical protein